MNYPLVSHCVIISQWKERHDISSPQTNGTHLGELTSNE